jgi:hypothetical protein
MAQSPLAQDINFIQPHILSYKHIDLRRRKILRRHESRRVTIDRFFANKHASGMNA